MKKAVRRLAFVALLGACLVELAEGADSVAWRAFDANAFEEARREKRPVFLVLTAPWNWDHFFLAERHFSDETVIAKLGESYVPILADATLFPELRGLYSIGSGLLPSFHFVEASGEPFASFPPLAPEELVFYLDAMLEEDRPSAPGFETTEIFEINGKQFANRAARLVLDRFARADSGDFPPHREIDFSTLEFLLEFGIVRPRRDAHHVFNREIRKLLDSGLHDAIDGGFHRAPALPDGSVAHFEKTLRPNAVAGGLLASWYRITGDQRLGAAALMTLRSLNESFRSGATTLYAGSVAADVYDEEGRELIVEGKDYHRLGVLSRRRLGRPPCSNDVPVGANFAVHRALVEYYRSFLDARMHEAVLRAGEILAQEGLLANGAARRALGSAAIGNLRDQADAGRGLLAVHGLTGDSHALEAARKLGRRLLEDFWDSKRNVFLNVARQSALPEHVRTAAPDAGWNGAVLGFLAELAAVTGEERFGERAIRGLRAWADRIPVHREGVGELGLAALRLEAPLPVLVVAARPETDSGAELRELAFRLFDRLLLVRWIDPDDSGLARRFGIDLEETPALYLAWDRTSGALRSATALRATFDEARDRVRARP